LPFELALAPTEIKAGSGRNSQGVKKSSERANLIQEEISLKSASTFLGYFSKKNEWEINELSCNNNLSFKALTNWARIKMDCRVSKDWW